MLIVLFLTCGCFAGWITSSHQGNAWLPPSTVPEQIKIKERHSHLVFHWQWCAMMYKVSFTTCWKNLAHKTVPSSSMLQLEMWRLLNARFAWRFGVPNSLSHPQPKFLAMFVVHRPGDTPIINQMWFARRRYRRKPRQIQRVVPPWTQGTWVPRRGIRLEMDHSGSKSWVEERNMKEYGYIKLYHINKMK